MKASGRSLCHWGAVLALALMLTSQAALAERVAVSALEGDKKDKLRAQVTAALRKTRKVQVLPPAAWAMAAGKLGLRGPASVTAGAVKLVAPKLQVDAVLTGSVGTAFSARLVSRDGQEVWAGEYPLKAGVLPAKESQKLALDVAAAVKEPRKPAASEPVTDATPAPSPEPGKLSTPRMLEPESPSTQEQAPAPKKEEAPARAEAPAPKKEEPPARAEAPAPKKEEPAPKPPKQAPPAQASSEARAEAPSASEEKPEPAWVQLDDESHTYLTELPGSAGGFPENTSARAAESFPPRVQVQLGAAVTWRKYCARPGVKSCAEYDALPADQQTGDTADFSSSAPYAGIAAEAEVFPLSHWPSLLRGVGLTLGYQRSYAKTAVQVTSPSGSTPSREVYATDTAYGAMLAYRYYFDLKKTDTPLWGYAGLRVGAMGREFAVDEAVVTPLPVAHRFYPVVGLDVAVPLLRYVRIQAAGQFFVMPSPGQSFGTTDTGSRLAEVRDYGTSVSSLGWAAELGLAGDIWGPIGYSARVRLEHYQDTFSGSGTRRGWTSGGVAEDTFSGILAGVTASW